MVSKTEIPTGIEFKVLRIRRGLRQYQVAERIGVHPARLSEIEAGRRTPTPQVLNRLLDALDVKDSIGGQEADHKLGEG